jgi:hypothetical protein
MLTKQNSIYNRNFAYQNEETRMKSSRNPMRKSTLSTSGSQIIQTRAPIRILSYHSPSSVSVPSLHLSELNLLLDDTETSPKALAPQAPLLTARNSRDPHSAIEVPPMDLPPSQQQGFPTEKTSLNTSPATLSVETKARREAPSPTLFSFFSEINMTRSLSAPAPQATPKKEHRLPTFSTL